MVESEHRHDLALHKFLSERPELQNELDELNPLQARASGMTLEQAKAHRLQSAFEQEAYSRGVDAWELTLELIAESPEQLQALKLEVHKEVMEMTGMTWVEYCQAAGLDPDKIQPS